MVITIRRSTPADSQTILTLWHDTVKATHGFLSKQDFNLIYQELSSLIAKTPVTLAINKQNKIIGFMILNNNHIEALFIDHTLHRQGIGRLLIEYALSQFSNVTTTVNEQNIQSVRFYTHIGFQQTHRTERDQQNRPYPILYLSYTNNQ